MFLRTSARLRWIIYAPSLAAALAVSAFGQSADSAAAPPPVIVGGFIDAYFNFNFDRPTSHVNQFRNFDVAENQFVLSMAEVSVTKAPSPVGFRVDADFGPTNDLVQGGLPGSLANIGQAYITYVAPMGAGLTIDVGKFVTHMGFEVIKAKDDYNYSRSLLFALSIPYNHIGLRASYPVSDKLTLMGCIHNNLTGLPTVNSGKSFGFAAIFTPMSTLSIIANWLGGPDRPDTGITASKKWRNVGELIVSYSPTPKLTVAVDWVYGQQTPETVSGPLGLELWRGVAGYVRYAICDPSILTLRGELYDDPAGFTTSTGTPQRIYEGTFTYEYKGLSNLILRAEYRYDWTQDHMLSNLYDGDTGHSTRWNQATFAIGAIVVF